MPVPVPLCTKQPAHPVVKTSQPRHPEYPSIFQTLTHSLPLPPSGPPPSFATREEWISSLPSWRRNKPRRIWEEDTTTRATSYQYCGQQGFEEGLAVAGNASVIKGEHAQACIPPISTLIASAGLDITSPGANMYGLSDADADDEMSESSAQADGWQYDDEYDDSSSADVGYEDDISGTQAQQSAVDAYGAGVSAQYYTVPATIDQYAEQSYTRGAFSPVFEDMSPEVPEYHDPVSSPIGPSTPFTEFVDKAVASVHQDGARLDVPQDVYNYHHHVEYCPPQCHQCHVDAPMQAAAAPEPVVTPSATDAYKKLAEPLSEWLASYVWKMCTTGLSLPPNYAQPSAFLKHYPSHPPSHLATSINSMLLSTLLQPSAVFLAIWYLKHLPIFFGPVNLLPSQRSEMRFRAELLGEAYTTYDRDVIETYAPFRLVVLGCMLANKWLDDHTFSNKTWHTISNVPIQSLNRLESLALEHFDYDVSISLQEWEDWLSYLTAYHLSLSSPAFPQPISRPSTSPHTIVRKALESLLYAKATGHACQQCDEDNRSAGPPVPVFLGIEEKKREVEKEHAQENVDVLEIDLDEDGPLREEYLPRRRTSGAGSTYRARASALEAQRALPPPAKWSPAGDEPIIRDNVRGHGQYVAPQATVLIPPLPPPFAPAQTLDARGQMWSLSGYLTTQEPMGRMDYPAAPGYAAPAPYNGYEYGYPSHSRSQSLSYQQAIGGTALPHGRIRSYSQTRFDYGYSDVRMSENHYLPALPTSAWPTLTRPDIPSIHERPFELHARPSVKV